MAALEMNRKEDAGYECKLICIEPFEMPWLKETGSEIIRKKVEDVDISFLEQLKEYDILFIDSSHIILPQSDVFYMSC